MPRIEELTEQIKQLRKSKELHKKIIQESNEYKKMQEIQREIYSITRMLWVYKDRKKKKDLLLK